MIKTHFKSTYTRKYVHIYDKESYTNVFASILVCEKIYLYYLKDITFISSEILVVPQKFLKYSWK